MPTAHELALLNAAREAEITTREELANFMGQMSHESAGLTRLEEGFRYTRGVDAIPVSAAFREGRETLEAARVAALEGRPQELGRLMYGNRMGNDDAGDGYRYRGRSYVMLTGEENYRAAGAALDMDLVGNPELAADRANAPEIALWYWRQRVPAADRDDVSAASRSINGGDNGLADRHNRVDAWRAQLTPEFLADVDAGRVQAGAPIGPLVGQPAMADGGLRRLETGADVRNLQEDLRDLNVQGARNQPLRVNGTFDAATERAVRNFQTQQELPVTGRANADTLERVQDAVERREQQPGPLPRAHPDGRQRERGEQPPLAPGRRASAEEASDERVAQTSTHPLYGQAEAAVRRLDESMGRQYDNTSACMAGSLACLAKQNGFERIDHALLSIQSEQTRAGERVFIVQGDPADPAKRRTQMQTQEAIAVPVEESLQRLTALEQAAPQQTQTQQLDQSQQQQASRIVLA